MESVSAAVLCVQVLPDDEMMADLYIMAVEVGGSTIVARAHAHSGHWRELGLGTACWEVYQSLSVDVCCEGMLLLLYFQTLEENGLMRYEVSNFAKHVSVCKCT